MVRVLYLIENGSYRFDHRARRKVCQYVEGGDPQGLANMVMELADDPKRRKTFGEAGRTRVENVLAWPHQAPNLIRIHDRFFPGKLTAPEIPCASV